MRLDGDKLKEGYLYEGDDPFAPLIGKVIISQLADLSSVVLAVREQQKVLKTDPIVWDGEHEVIVYASAGTILLAVDPEFPEYLHGQLEEVVKGALMEEELKNTDWNDFKYYDNALDTLSKSIWNGPIMTQGTTTINYSTCSHRYTIASPSRS